MSAPVATSVCVPPGHNGPPSSAHGGIAAGLIARAAEERLDGTGPVAVTLLVPPPLDRPLAVSGAGRRVQVREADGALVAAAQRGALQAPPEAAEPEAAESAEAWFCPGPDDLHPFPSCAVCGPDPSAAGPALRLRPGRLPGADAATACTWRPTDAVDDVMIWAALDCPGGWTDDPTRRPSVLQRMTVRIERPVRPGRLHVISAERTRDGDRTFTVSSALHADGDLLAHATAIWTRLDPGR